MVEEKAQAAESGKEEEPTSMMDADKKQTLTSPEVGEAPEHSIAEPTSTVEGAAESQDPVSKPKETEIEPVQEEAK